METRIVKTEGGLEEAMMFGGADLERRLKPGV